MNVPAFFFCIHVRSKYNDKRGLYGAAVRKVVRAGADGEGVVIEDTVTALPITQTLGGTSELEHASMEAVLINVAKIGTGDLNLEKEESLKLKHQINTVMSDGASTAYKVSLRHALSIVADHKRKNPGKVYSNAELSKAVDVIVISCDMHNLNNSAKAICTAIDEYAAARLHYTDAEAAALESSEIEFVMGKKGWSRYVYETWKYFLDSTYVFGERQNFLSWLEKNHDPFHRDLCNSAGRIVGNRFVQDHRAAMVLLPLAPLMRQYLHEVVVPYHGAELSANKLAQSMLKFFDQGGCVLLL